ncbi:MAG: hypothetical protein ONB44_14155 [candidate division KSB1 bacterium]|nr:hypothetical protein [candidate division KSB1 bacterium]
MEIFWLTYETPTNLEDYGEKQKQAASHAYETAPKAAGAHETPQSHAETTNGGGHKGLTPDNFGYPFCSEKP